MTARYACPICGADDLLQIEIGEWVRLRRCHSATAATRYASNLRACCAHCQWMGIVGDLATKEPDNAR